MTEIVAVLGVGPSFGLGAAIARRFAKGGFRVFIAGHNPARLDESAETYWQLHHQGKSAWTFETELRPFKESF